MERKPLLAPLEKLNTAVFFGIIFLYLILFSFQGLDFSDEGFIVTFYQQIFKSPESVEYNFMFWFSGIIGGGFAKLFPHAGLWGFRLLGALTTTASLLLSYQLLKKYANRGNLKIAILVTLLVFSNNVKSFHYNTLSSFLYVVTATFLFTGLKRDNLLRIFIAGMFIALDGFTRTASVINLGMAVCIIYYGIIYKNSFAKQFKQLLAFGIGFIISLFGVLMIMKAIGHYDHFMNTMQVIRNMGSGGTGSDYGVFKLIKGFIKNYGKAVIIATAVLGIIGALLYIMKRVSKRESVVPVFFVLLLIGTGLLMYKNILSHNKLVLFYTGGVLLTAAVIFFKSRDKDLKTMNALAVFTMLAYPLGSSDSLNTAGIYSFWLALPLAVNYVLGEYADQTITRRDWVINPALFSGKGWQQIKYGLLAICICVSIYYAYYYPLFDNSERTKMVYEVKSDRMKHILTTRERADSVSAFLAVAEKYVSPGDDMLVYPSIAMAHYMTQTSPYLHNPAPWVYEPDFFKKTLDDTYAEKKMLPVVVTNPLIKNELAAYHAGQSTDTSAWDKKNMQRTLYFEEFLQKNGYREVWGNNLFIIYAPPGK